MRRRVGRVITLISASRERYQAPRVEPQRWSQLALHLAARSLLRISPVQPSSGFTLPRRVTQGLPDQPRGLSFIQRLLRGASAEHPENEITRKAAGIASTKHLVHHGPEL